MGLSEAVLETLATPVAVVDGTGRIVDDNASWRRFVDRDDHPLVPDDDRPYPEALAASDDDRATAVATRLRALLDGTTAACPYETHVDVGGDAFAVWRSSTRSSATTCATI